MAPPLPSSLRSGGPWTLFRSKKGPRSETRGFVQGTAPSTKRMFLLFGALPPMPLGDDTAGIVALESMHFVAVAGVLVGILKWGRGG